MWSLRTGTTDTVLLKHTLLATEGMDSSAPEAADLSTFGDARMRRIPYERALLRAEAPGEVTYVDVFSVSKHDLPAGVDGETLGMQNAIMFVDSYSRHETIFLQIAEGVASVREAVHATARDTSSHRRAFSPRRGFPSTLCAHRRRDADELERV